MEDPSVAELAETIKTLEMQIHSLKQRHAMKIASDNSSTESEVARRRMTSAVVDNNRYSRLMALQTMGVIQHYVRLAEQTVVVVGIGGVGSVLAEMLTRCGIGKLILYDFDTVVEANLNRLFFRQEHCGLQKCVAAARTLKEVNPDVQLVARNADITSTLCYSGFCADILRGSMTGGPVDLVVSCVDNYGARLAINRACLHTGVTWMESGVSEDGVSGHIQTLCPGVSACFECLPPLAVATSMDERLIRREGVCAASLPTVMGAIASILAQNVLKYLLEFGEICWYQGYNSLTNYFHSQTLLPSEICVNEACRERQISEKSKSHLLLPRMPAMVRAEGDVTHADNEWGIEITDGGVEAIEAPDAKAAIATATGNNDAETLDDLAQMLEEMNAQAKR